MKRSLLVILFAMAVSMALAQKHALKNYSGEWKNVDSLANIGQPKSALKIVDEIYKSAKAEKNDPQLVKAIIRKASLRQDFTENPEEQKIYFLQEEIKKVQPPVKNILTSMLANSYNIYYEINRWKLHGRSTVRGNISDSISTWDLVTLRSVTNHTYLQSLQNEELLKTIPVGEYEAILKKNPEEDSAKKEKISFRPTLYDLLAWQVLEYFFSDRDYPVKPANGYSIKDPAHFLPAAEWVKLPPIPFDTTSLQSYALRIFRSLTAFHLPDKDPRALIDLENLRLAYVHQEATFADKDSLYILALKRAENLYQSSPWSTDFSYALASFLIEQGQGYNMLVSENHRWDLKEALEICRKAIGKYPESEGAMRCRNLEKQILGKTILVQSEAQSVPDKPSLGLVSSKNLDKIYFRIIKITAAEMEEHLDDMFNRPPSYLRTYKPEKSWSVAVQEPGDHQVHDLEFQIPAIPAGTYFLIASSVEDIKDTTAIVAYWPLTSTFISYISRQTEGKGLFVYLLDRETGKPLKQAKVETYVKSFDYGERKYISRKTGELKADDEGFLMIPPKPQGEGYGQSLNIYWKDEVLSTEVFSIYPDYRRDRKEVVWISLFTDRAIYRPGQTVYFKGIMTSSKGKTRELLTGRTVQVTFYDVNSRKIDEKTFTTNEFGSINGSFTIPLSGLKGRMSISTPNGSVGFSVEEYKRPTFEAEIDPMKGNYHVNDSIRVTGKAKAYAGNAISGATVKYSVIRRTRYLYIDEWLKPIPATPGNQARFTSPWHDISDLQITSGTTTTDADGNFALTFFAYPDESLLKTYEPVFDYEVTADVTDVNGETNSVTGTVSAGYTSLVLSTDLQDQFNLKKDSSLVIRSENLNGLKTPVPVEIEIQRLKQPEQMIVHRKWETPGISGENREKWPVEATVLKKTMDTGKDSVIYLKKEIQGLVPGVYKIKLEAKDPFGKTATYSRTFVVFDPDAKVSPVNAMDWFLQLNTTAEPGENAEFLLGTREKDVNVLYEILINDSIISRQWIRLDNEMRRLSIPVKEEYRGGFSVNLIFIRNNNAYAHSFGISVPWSNKKLDLKLETFRDKMIPGEKEEWRLKITGPGGNLEKAELLAAMYDASLDVFQQNDWYFNLWYPNYSNRPWTWEPSFSTGTAAGIEHIHEMVLPQRYYEEFNWQGNIEIPRSRFLYDQSTMEMAVVETDAQELPPPPPPPTGGMADKSARIPNASEIPPTPEPAAKAVPVKVRSDFRETAFFYPSLVTDSAGSIILKFTAPEALTSWKFMGLAHTKDLKSGRITKEVITQKDLMVFPNAPRFVRQGDTIIFSTGIVNLSNRALDGEVTLAITDPVSGLPMKMMTENGSKRFTIPAGQKTAVSWKLIIPADPAVSMMQYRITAVSGNFSDGEEKMIPVLTNRMMVTESLPLPVRGSGTFDFSFDKLKNSSTGKTLKNHSLTLEFASNPVWYAVQALPVLDEPKYQSADALFNTFYANSIAMHISGSDASIRKVFESWKRITPDALLSNLEKNQELKSAVLEETPWVMEAKDESQQKQRIGELFDEENMKAKLQSSLSKLLSLQRPEGGWSWFEGMTPSRYTTQQIVNGFGHLNHLGIEDIRDDKETWNMITKAVLFTDHELVRDYEWMKKNVKDFEKQNNLSGEEIYYLYGRSYFLKDIPLEKSTQEAFDFYRRQAEKYWTKGSIYFQGMIALSLNRLGNKSLPGMIMKSLSEKALHLPEMGMYWAMNEGYYWYEAPVETEALLIEAYDEVLADKASVDEMNIWLLKNKQTNGWKTGRATAEACYALLLRGTSLLTKNQKVTFEIGDKKIDPLEMTDNRAEAGTGYFKTTWNGKDITPEMGNVRIHKTGDGIAWGAMYWQYFEDLDKITAAKSPLKLEKQVTLVTSSPSGPVLVPVTNATALQPGDKLKIRVVVTADRDLEYVHLKDMRAAGLEPVAEDAVSGYRFSEGLGYYQSVSDVAMNFFFDHLPKGTFVFEYPLKVNAAGNYSNGITTIQCMYAPEFGAHSEGIRLQVP